MQLTQATKHCSIVIAVYYCAWFSDDKSCYVVMQTFVV